ncbi:MAG: hypothetical protein MRERV_9c006 [Mycoplasmataceae bacterium RV_VA103A]|nr:MAG: hypothetical protein MRERV_9c006 [Mycoplasmataceae bacterium RV_VA103A]
MALPANLNKKQVKRMSTEKLLWIIENSPYRCRGEAIGNDQTIQYAFEVLHERKEIDCETAYCFEHEPPKNYVPSNFKNGCWDCLKAQQDPAEKYICPKYEQHWIEYEKWENKYNC